MREEDITFTAFQAPNGLWEYLVLPMGVCNAPATMHRLTSKIFRDLKNTGSFYDDIYIFTKSPRIEDHRDVLRETLDILPENKLYVKLSKCIFCAEEIPYLGDFVGRNEYTTLTASMFALLKKKNKRNAIVRFNNELLKIFNVKFAVGGVLFQVVNGVERPIAYTSHKMKPAESNYPTQQQELVYQSTFSRFSGARNGMADTLSQRPDLQPKTKFFHDLSITSFNGTSFSLAISDVVMNSNFISKIKKAYNTDREVGIFLAPNQAALRNSETQRA
ncbi:RxLR effector candidate protein [Phytophthora palmivora]|uniref:RxLR effector candidate protein n=1 Tax=Phytophthora palmivora TaxID=4796 RepID=A0A2P4Y2N4_9STRA|nr:RxLR effector candidate protein [Phytophthora palmivora]